MSEGNRVLSLQKRIPLARVVEAIAATLRLGETGLCRVHAVNMVLLGPHEVRVMITVEGQSHRALKKQWREIFRG